MMKFSRFIDSYKITFAAQHYAYVAACDDPKTSISYTLHLAAEPTYSGKVVKLL